MNQPVAVGLLIAVLVVGLFAGVGGPIVAAGDGGLGADAGLLTVAGPADTTAEPSAADAQPQHEHVTVATTDEMSAGDFDSTTFEITVHENGSATWTFRYEHHFDESNETTRSEFETFADEFESDETDLYTLFSEQAQAMVETGDEQTEREMDATAFNRSAQVDGTFNPVGVVEMTFTWHGFAAVEDESILVGDVFENQNLILTEEQAMELQASDGLAFEHVEPEAQYVGTSLSEANSVHWSGERQFLDGHPRVELTKTDEGADSPLTAMTDNTNSSWLFAAGALIILAGSGGAVWYRRHRSDSSKTPEHTATDDQTAVSDTPDTGARTSHETAAQRGTTPAAGGHQTPDSSTETDTDESASANTPHPPLSEDDLLTDEDRVVKLIRENGGRMKQVNIVDETGWSKSKVSMLLSEMEADDTISKLRVGRENIISLEGFEPEATKSPFDNQE
ncbi:hypothetical protein G6M89_09660 [Natronolimnobius sp. AArcel1]|uniref:helix-turn-helix transcriptional regulator n=1 Tax=Natronolimnobius sp. AArcel1 TaxID=1679093 RepID=UPI0013EB6B5F|nr:hypothetical protein [Natronolimnobius sp. AArcel1]NGM69270.1 hypothetical protein [Natronolimnobius sp. AArcel1]